MAIWSIESATIALVKAGFPKSVPLLTVGTAICWAESGFNPEARSSTGDYGLWQINKAAHGDLFQKYTWNNGYDNAKMARAVYVAAHGWTPWTTYKNGAYKQYLEQCRVGVINGLKGDPGRVGSGLGLPNPLGGIEGAIGSLTSAFSTLFNLLGKLFDPSLWVRIGTGLLGAFTVMAGLYMLFEGTDTGKAATKVAELAAMK